MSAPAIALVPLGMILGSFVSVVAHRVPRGESIVTGRSRCPSCGTTIAAYDNVPLVSWIVLRGRCRGCEATIPAHYPATELGLGVLFAVTALVVGTDDLGELALGLALCTMLAAITITDLERRVIPNRVLLVGAGAALAIGVGTDPSAVPGRVLAAVISGGLLFVVAMAYPRGMGMGDVKLVAVMGLYLGRAVAPALLVAFAVGALVGVAMIARRGSGARKTTIPFGPFLALGALVGLWVGDSIVDWYLDEFFSQA